MKKENSTDRVGIGSRLRMARELAGLSQEQVAEMLSMRRPSISEIESGRRKVSADELVKLSEVYDVRVSWLMGADDAEKTGGDQKVRLAARELAKLKKEDYDRVMFLLRMLRSSEGER
jgi:transcriptional regulator with XRE-family HTH domain